MKHRSLHTYNETLVTSQTYNETLVTAQTYNETLVTAQTYIHCETHHQISLMYVDILKIWCPLQYWPYISRLNFFAQVFRRHICQLLLHDFPEHYGEVLNMVLRGSVTQSLSLDVWFDVLNALMSGGGENLARPRRLRSGQTLARLKEEARIYATEQKMLTYLQVRIHSRQSLLKS